MDALLTDASSRISYSALRSLCSLGLEVAVADTSLTGMCQWSKLAKARYKYRSPYVRPEEFIEDINKILRETGAKFLLPGYGETEILAKFRDRFPKDVVLPVAGYDSICLANDKYETAVFAKKLGVPVPEIIEWKSLEELEEKLKRESCPIIVKTRRGHSAKGVFYPRNTWEVISKCRELIYLYGLDRERYPMVQKKVNGSKWGVASVYFEGKELSSITQHMLREKPVSGGTGTYRVTAQNPVLEDYTRRILSGLEWHGIVMAEYKYDASADKYWLIELNPRLWGSISHAVASNADFVKLLYVASKEGLKKAAFMAKPCRQGIYGRWIMGDLMIAASAFKKFRVAEGIRVFAGRSSDDYDDFKIDDPGAFWGQCAYFLKKKFYSLSTKDVDITLG